MKRGKGKAKLNFKKEPDEKPKWNNSSKTLAKPR